ncbi:hypothetical protein [Sporosarcina sp. D27]|uniref:hypothetical protein n=1 Tax=Sporosarcina sp. D27 TaxID=1382305 RepID=UPI00046E9B5A|nr:hypothetical protein [Sporosarcina sp. D27]
MKGHRLGIFTAVAMACVIIAGCSQQGEASEGKETKTETVQTAESSVEMNIKTIEAVLKEELNGPDIKYGQLADAAMGGNNDPNSVEQKENVVRLNSYVKERYQQYFTEEGLKEFQSSGLKSYHSYYDTEFEIRLVESEIKQSNIDTASNQYHIKSIVELTSPGEEPSLHEVEGQVIFSTKEGKIERFYLGQKDPTLSDKIFELGQNN